MDITNLKICKKSNSTESEFNKFEKIKLCCNKCRYLSKTRNIEYFKQYYETNKEIIQKQSKINYNKNKKTNLSLILYEYFYSFKFNKKN